MKLSIKVFIFHTYDCIRVQYTHVIIWIGVRNFFQFWINASRVNSLPFSLAWLNNQCDFFIGVSCRIVLFRGCVQYIITIISYLHRAELHFVYSGRCDEKYSHPTRTCPIDRRRTPSHLASKQPTKNSSCRFFSITFIHVHRTKLAHRQIHY